MSTTEKRGSLFFLCVKFVVFLVPLVWGWWSLLPYYAEGLMQVSGRILVSVFDFPIDSGHIVVGGLLNTETQLSLVSQGRGLKQPIAVLVTNVAPYWALVLATSGITWLRRIWILLFGSAILIAGHILFIVLAVRLKDLLAINPEIPYAVSQFYLTLPFLLWIVLAYWDKIAGYMGESKDGSGTRDVSAHGDAD